MSCLATLSSSCNVASGSRNFAVLKKQFHGCHIVIKLRGRLNVKHPKAISLPPFCGGGPGWGAKPAIITPHPNPPPSRGRAYQGSQFFCRMDVSLLKSMPMWQRLWDTIAHELQETCPDATHSLLHPKPNGLPQIAHQPPHGSSVPRPNPGLATNPRSRQHRHF